MFIIIILAKYRDRQACANHEESDHVPQTAAYDQSLHCLQLV